MKKLLLTTTTLLTVALLAAACGQTNETLTPDTTPPPRVTAVTTPTIIAPGSHDPNRPTTTQPETTEPPAPPTTSTVPVPTTPPPAPPTTTTVPVPTTPPPAASVPPTTHEHTPEPPAPTTTPTTEPASIPPSPSPNERPPVTDTSTAAPGGTFRNGLQCFICSPISLTSRRTGEIYDTSPFHTAEELAALTYDELADLYGGTHPDDHHTWEGVNFPFGVDEQWTTILAHGPNAHKHSVAWGHMAGTHGPEDGHSHIGSEGAEWVRDRDIRGNRAYTIAPDLTSRGLGYWACFTPTSTYDAFTYDQRVAFFARPQDHGCVPWPDFLLRNHPDYS